ncbi:hypothetical protein NBH00_22145 [Paraconexibacter antarcticus]|uniref:Uncharacterized protein n=1 Tax=Paraconexibacter antarcticus TaxID=2949664 RepID=A0ABY5DPR5_9ACTN|nr:hypothetical protein [Paraconexibacter antarcticus]UTI64025.1 hypothetical protein NBH00_22145 [Paraconexibacter antarcticus]
MARVLVPATETVDATWFILPVLVLVVLLVAVNARRAGRDGGPAATGAEVARSAPHAVASIVGTLLVVAGGVATAAATALLPFILVIDALGGHALGSDLLVPVTGAAVLTLGAALLGRSLRELWPRRRR